MASAMVPGPALVTIQSEAAMRSSMFETNPRTSTSTPADQALLSSCCLAFSFFPQTITSCDSGTSPLLPSSASMASVTLTMPPTPSPPPTTRAVGTPFFSPRTWRISSLERDSCSQNPERRGSPCKRSCSGAMPQLRAICRTGSDGTKQTSTLGSNQVGCAPPRSVTTVTKGTCRWPPPISFRARRGISWQSGWTETTTSGFSF
mmetsp:Transcript_24262/g.71257  ORF Transcript_24262/g.71257 Transcript_24262/m.71257 type:complete len:204 (-) Transcript_24262:761-1372(-)